MSGPTAGRAGARHGDELVVLRGGSRDGESTKVQEGVRRLLAPSDAPGLLEVYEANGETEDLAGNAEPALVFVHAGQQPARRRGARAAARPGRQPVRDLTRPGSDPGGRSAPGAAGARLADGRAHVDQVDDHRDGDDQAEQAEQPDAEQAQRPRRRR